MGTPHNTQSPLPNSPHPGLKKPSGCFLVSEAWGSAPLGAQVHSIFIATGCGDSADPAVGPVQIRVVLSLRVHLPDVAGSGSLVDDSPHVGSGWLSLVQSPSHGTAAPLQ